MKKTVLVFLSLLALFPATVFARLNVSVTQNPALYQILDALTAFGLIDDQILGQRPYSKTEVLRLIDEAQKNLPRIQGTMIEPRAMILLRQIRHFLPRDGSEEKKFNVTPLQQFSLQYLYLDSPYRAVPANVGLGRIDALVNPLVAYYGGRPYQDGQNFVYEMGQAIHISRHFDIAGQPQFFFEKPAASGAQDILQWNFDHLYLRSEFANIGIQIGRDQLVWGIDPEGGSVYSTDARGIDMFKLSNISPFHLPWIFKYLGKMDATFIFGVLGNDQYFPHPYMTAYKLSLLPHKNFEWAFTYALISGGEGSPSTSFGSRVEDALWGYIPNLFGGDSPTSNQDAFASNRVGGFEFLLRIPKWRGTQIYYEVTLEDFNIPQYQFIHESTNRVGIFIPRFSADGRKSLRLEYKNSGFLPYRHDQFASGWTHHQKLMGDELGPDAQGVYLRYGYHPTFYFQNELGFAWEQRDSDLYRLPPSGAVQRAANNPDETRYRFWSRMRWRHSDLFEMALNVGYERVRQFNFTPGNDRNNFLTDLKLTWHPSFD